MPKPFGHKAAAFTAAKAEQARTLKLRDVFGRSPGPGPKIQTPRTDAQRDQADTWGHEPLFSPKRPVTETVPKTSWWTTPKTREEFHQAAAQQRDRMKSSVFGKFKAADLP